MGTSVLSQAAGVSPVSCDALSYTRSQHKMVKVLVLKNPELSPHFTTKVHLGLARLIQAIFIFNVFLISDLVFELEDFPEVLDSSP